MAPYTLLLLIALISSAAYSTFAATRPAAGTGSTEFIRRSCSSTAYPTLCFSSLSSHASAIQQNPKLLATTALSISLGATRATSADIVNLAHVAGLSPRDSSAMRDCMEELSDSVDQLRKSMVEMNQITGSNFEMLISDVQTWVSAAMTNENMCVEGFVAGRMREGVRRQMLNVVHTTSNALALVNSYAALHA